MRLPYRLLLLLAFWSAACSSASGAPKSEGSLYLLAITVGTHQENGTPDDWNYTAVELEQIVKAHCAPLFSAVKSNLVKGSQATPEGVMKGFEWLQQNVKEHDLAFVYIGSHGGSNEERGFCLFANGGTVYGDEIKPALAKVKGKVVFVIQACEAGDLLVKHGKELRAMPTNVAAVCACRANQVSHGVMLPPIMEGLHGWADADEDGLVTVAEFLRYIVHRIGDFYPGKYAETQHAVTAEPKGFDLSTPLAQALPPQKIGREFVMATYKNDWYGGVVLPKKDPMNQGRRWVHFFSDEPKDDGWIEKERICPPGAEAVAVRKGDKWYTALLLKQDGDAYLIQYVGALDDKEETIHKARLRAYLLDGAGTPRKKRGKS